MATTNLFSQQYQTNEWNNTTNSVHQYHQQQWNDTSPIHEYHSQWNNSRNSGQISHAIHPYTTYPPQPSSVSSLTSNISQGSSLSAESTSSSSSPPSIDPVGLYNGIPVSPQQVDNASRPLNYYPSTYNGNNYYGYQLPIDSSVSQWSTLKKDDFHLSKLLRRCQRCNCKNCQNELAGIPSVRDQKGQKQHLCHFPGCKKVYGKTSHLKAHLRSHTGERPFICNWIYCGKKFTRSDELLRHSRIHTEERPFSCSICGKDFMRSDHLSKHFKIHTKKTTVATDDTTKNKNENPPAEEHRQLDTIVDNIVNEPKSTFPQELSILTNQTQSSGNPVYNSQKSPLPIFHAHLPNQVSSHQNYFAYNNPSSMFYQFSNNNNNCIDPINSANGINIESQNGINTTTSSYNEQYNYDNYHHHYSSGASQPQVYPLYPINYGNNQCYY